MRRSKGRKPAGADEAFTLVALISLGVGYGYRFGLYGGYNKRAVMLASISSQTNVQKLGCRRCSPPELTLLVLTWRATDQHLIGNTAEEDLCCETSKSS